MQRYFVMASAGTHAAIDLEAMNDPALSWKAKALHYFIRTRGEVVTNQDALVAAGPEGRDAVNNGVKELIQRGYLHLTQVREEDGRFKYAAYISFPKPAKLTEEQLTHLIEHGTIEQPYTGKPDTGKPLSGGPLTRTPADSLSVSVRNTLLDIPKGISNNGVSYGDGAVAVSIEQIFTHWNKQPCLPTHRRGAQYKTYQTSIAHIQTALRHHAPMIIKQAIDNYNELLGDPYTVLRGNAAPVRVGLNEFFKFAAYSNRVRDHAKHPLQKMKSWFDECSMGMEYLLNVYGALRTNKHPIVANALTGALKEGGIITGEPTPIDINAIRTAAERVVAFYKNQKDVLPARIRPPDLARELVNAVEGAKHAGYLLSDITWNNFENYLAEQGIMERRLNVKELKRAATGAGI
jgi:hypothetical protein